jgi:hypothetical protein
MPVPNVGANNWVETFVYISRTAMFSSSPPPEDNGKAGAWLGRLEGESGRGPNLYLIWTLKAVMGGGKKT